AVIDDLVERGLFDSTLVVAMGEFGRSPKINDKAGREHWEHCYSALVFGSGVKGGRVIGSSDARAEHVRDTMLTPADVAATVQHLAGVTSEQAATLNVALPQARGIEGLF